MSEVAGGPDQDEPGLAMNTPYPRSAVGPPISSWSERMPWVASPYAAIILIGVLVGIRGDMYGPLGIATPSMLFFTVVAVASFLLWILSCYVMYRNLVCAVERLVKRRPWAVAACNGAISFVVLFVSAVWLFFVYIGPD